MIPVITPDKARQLTHDRLKSIEFGPSPDPVSALKSFPWEIPKGPPYPDQETMSRWNQELDPKSCFTRLALGAALVEASWPESHIGAGEVLSDYLRSCMLRQIRAGLPDGESLRTEWLREVLAYEEPHSVLLLDDGQFDPISTVLGHDFQHSRIWRFSIWEHVACGMLVSHAVMSPDPDVRFELLGMADTICPGTAIVKENRVAALILADREAEAVKLMEDCLLERPTARGNYVMWLMTGNKAYRAAIADTYTPHMLAMLDADHEAALKGVAS